jgi:hypothetical protein
MRRFLATLCAWLRSSGICCWRWKTPSRYVIRRLPFWGASRHQPVLQIARNDLGDLEQFVGALSVHFNLGA